MKSWLEDAARPSIRKSTFYNYEMIVRKHILPYIGGVLLGQLNPGMIQRMLSDLEENKIGARTRQLAYVVLRKALGQAVRWGYLNQNLCERVDRPAVKPRAMQVLNPQETVLFLKAASTDRYYPLFLLAVTTGLRLGELLGLKWADLNTKTRMLSVQRTVYEIKGEFEIGHPKTSKGKRAVILPHVAFRALEKHRLVAKERPSPDSWLFCDTLGGLIRRHNFRKRHFKPILRRAGLPDIRFHDLRHTAATLLLSEGVHPKVVQERLGHAQIGITLDTYSHVLPSMQTEASNKIDSLLSSNGIDAIGCS